MSRKYTIVIRKRKTAKPASEFCCFPKQFSNVKEIFICHVLLLLLHILHSKKYDNVLHLNPLHFPHCAVALHLNVKGFYVQRGGGFTQAGVPQRFGRATNFQIPTKLSAGVFMIISLNYIKRYF